MLYRTDENGNLIKIAGNSNNGYNGHCLPVGSIFSSVIPQTSNNYHLLNGDSLSISGVYSGFYNLINTLVSQGYSLTCSANEYAEDIAKTGNCGKFVINTTSSTVTGTYTDESDNTTTINVSASSFKLPTITMFIQGLSNLTNIGDSIEAGLPNITGSFYIRHLNGGGEIVGGGVNSLYTTTSTNTSSNGLSYTKDSRNNIDINFDASRSSSIYGNSTTVQPASTQYPYYIVLISGSALSIEANPTLSGNEQNLNSIGIGGVNYKTKADYSTDEVDTGVKWIDGKTIYRKVWYYETAFTISYNDWTNLGFESATYNMDKFVSGKAINDGNTFYWISVAKNVDNIHVHAQATRTSSIGSIKYVILEYTKTTTSS